MTSGSGGLGRFFRTPPPAERLAALNVRSDVAAASLRMAASRRAESTSKAIGDLLPESELAVAMMEGRYDKTRGITVLTTRRLLFFGYERLVGVMAEIELGQLDATGISARGTRFEARTGDLVVIVDQTLGRSAEMFTASIHTQLAAPPPTPARDPLQALAEIRALHDAGVMSDAEFVAEKARLMDQI